MVTSPLSAAPEFLERLSIAFEMLLEGSEYARDAGQRDWEFAVEITDLQAAGLSKNAVRWLIHKGYAKCALEVTDPFGERGRQFRPLSNLVFPSTACLVLTEAGLGRARQLAEGSSTVGENLDGLVVSDTRLPPAAPRLPPPPTPEWDPDTRILRVGKVIVKHFKVPAGNQELILSAFQEEGWPAKIDDPLPPSSGIDAKRRLHDSINRLNRNQRSRLIHFKGNGNGRAVSWETAHVP